MTELMVFIFGLLMGMVITIFCMWLSGTISDIWYSIRAHTKENISDIVDDAIEKYEIRRGWHD